MAGQNLEMMCGCQPCIGCDLTTEHTSIFESQVSNRYRRAEQGENIHQIFFHNSKKTHNKLNNTMSSFDEINGSVRENQLFT